MPYPTNYFLVFLFFGYCVQKITFEIPTHHSHKPSEVGKPISRRLQGSVVFWRSLSLGGGRGQTRAAGAITQNRLVVLPCGTLVRFYGVWWEFIDRNIRKQQEQEIVSVSKPSTKLHRWLRFAAIVHSLNDALATVVLAKHNSYKTDTSRLQSVYSVT